MNNIFSKTKILTCCSFQISEDLSLALPPTIRSVTFGQIASLLWASVSAFILRQSRPVEFPPVFIVRDPLSTGV